MGNFLLVRLGLCRKTPCATRARVGGSRESELLVIFRKKPSQHCLAFDFGGPVLFDIGNDCRTSSKAS